MRFECSSVSSYTEHFDFSVCSKKFHAQLVVTRVASLRIQILLINSLNDFFRSLESELPAVGPDYGIWIGTLLLSRVVTGRLRVQTAMMT